MIVEVNDTILNIDNVCSVKKAYQDTDTPGLIKPCLYITFLNGKTESIECKNEYELKVAYATIRLFETTINKNRKK